MILNKSIKQTKKGNLVLFYTTHNFLLTPSLLIFLVFFCFPPPPHFCYIFFYPQIHRPYINPTSTLHEHSITFFSFVNSETIYHHQHHHVSIVSLHRHHHHHHHISVAFSPTPKEQKTWGVWGKIIEMVVERNNRNEVVMVERKQ